MRSRHDAKHAAIAAPNDGIGRAQTTRRRKCIRFARMARKGEQARADLFLSPDKYNGGLVYLEGKRKNHSYQRRQSCVSHGR